LNVHKKKQITKNCELYSLKKGAKAPFFYDILDKMLEEYPKIPTMFKIFKKSYKSQSDNVLIKKIQQL